MSEKLEKLEHEKYVAEKKLTAAIHGVSEPTAFVLVPECWRPF